MLSGQCGKSRRLSGIYDRQGVQILEGDTLMDASKNKYTVVFLDGSFYIRGFAGFSSDAPYSLNAVALFGRADTLSVCSSNCPAGV
jgi:hypothetical protein